ncbi:hypothetical protein C5167_011867 [Papaver somniferum]|uniref:Serine/threonine-protein kinase RIO1 n=1 Tax=Papaver somniferum TaxID=3469 RepID=A0A4Y7IWJ4_PAPSO|nr:serine/threonine-protein kinase RIO1-like isoform X2 [Papaver somniferum]RZC53017.1 hypothetical protein C5167_011867 [Papaver somniferum]
MDLEEFSEALDFLDSAKDDGAAIHLYSRRPNSHGGHLLPRTFQPLSNRNQKFNRHLRPSPLEKWEDKEDMSIPNSTTTANRQSLTCKTKTTDKRDRATVEQDIDPRTGMVLFKMLNRGIFDDINGCISTGKEANVYHATKDDGQEFAVKVYKTPVPGFKDGNRRIQRDYCFRRGYLKHNPRQMPKTWAENEMMNLMMLKAAGTRCPTPIFLRQNVLVMEFVGKSGRAAPCLKDANLSEAKMRECYVQMVMVMRILYQKCNLVHGDLSEYNILYYEGSLHIIDVSQSVDLDHPLALYFLRLDCIHVSDFFENNGVGVRPIHELLDFIVDSTITDESVECYLEKVQQEILARADVRSALFPDESYIPWFARGQDIIGLLYHCPAQKQLPKQPKESDTNDTSADTGTKSRTQDSKAVEPCDSVKEGTQEAVLPVDKKAARKVNKKKVKEEKREARKSKTPKALKKKKTKLSKNMKARQCYL